MVKKRVWLLLGFAALAGGFWLLVRNGVPLASLYDGKRSLSGLLGASCAILAGYEACVLGAAAAIHFRRKALSEVSMLASLLRAVAVVLILLALLDSLGKLTGSWAAVAGFSGLLLGWSLQAPVSGVAAWVLINVKRPFRVGDRVMLPAWGLTGDVRSIGMMYTVLNQVGGTVGSEEAAGRDVLIPNAMLFANVVINYTPEQAAAFVLDEVIVRITFNSNWELAEKILLDAAGEVTGDIIQQTGQKPYIRADIYDYGVYMRLRYTTLAMDRPRIVYEISRRIFDEFQKRPAVDFAIPYVFSHRTGLRAGHAQLRPGPGPEDSPVNVEAELIHDPSGAAARPENVVPVQDLTRKIVELGLLQPIVVEARSDGRYTVVAGHLRLAACKALGWKTIPAVVRPAP